MRKEKSGAQGSLAYGCVADDLHVRAVERGIIGKTEVLGCFGRTFAEDDAAVRRDDLLYAYILYDGYLHVFAEFIAEIRPAQPQLVAYVCKRERLAEVCIHVFDYPCDGLIFFERLVAALSVREQYEQFDELATGKHAALVFVVAAGDYVKIFEQAGHAVRNGIKLILFAQSADKKIGYCAVAEFKRPAFARLFVRRRAVVEVMVLSGHDENGSARPP